MNIAINFAALFHPFSLLFLLSAVFFFYDARKFLRTKKAIVEARVGGKLRKGLVKLAGEVVQTTTETSPLGVKECVFYRTYVRHYGMDPNNISQWEIYGEQTRKYCFVLKSDLGKIYVKSYYETELSLNSEYKTENRKFKDLPLSVQAVANELNSEGRFRPNSIDVEVYESVSRLSGAIGRREGWGNVAVVAEGKISFYCLYF